MRAGADVKRAVLDLKQHSSSSLDGAPPLSPMLIMVPSRALHSTARAFLGSYKHWEHLKVSRPPTFRYFYSTHDLQSIPNVLTWRDVMVTQCNALEVIFLLVQGVPVAGMTSRASHSIASGFLLRSYKLWDHLKVSRPPKLSSNSLHDLQSIPFYYQCLSTKIIQCSDLLL